MLNEPTIEQLRGLKLHALVAAWQEQTQQAAMQTLGFDERFALLIDAEWRQRENQRLVRVLKEAKLKLSQACIEDIDYSARRELDRAVIRQLATCTWVQEHHNVLITGATGVGKTFVACALAQQACRRGYKALYRRAPQGSPENRPVVIGPKPASRRVRDRKGCALVFLRRQAMLAGAPALGAAFDDVTIVEKTVKHGGDRRSVAEQLAPVIDGAVGRHDGTGAFVTPHDEFEEILGGGGGQLAHAKIVDDEQRHRLVLGHQFFARAIEGGVGDLFEQHVGFAVGNLVAVEDRRQADGLGQVALASARRAEEEDVFVPVDEVASGEFEDEAAVHLWVEGEVKAVQSSAGVAESGLLDAAFDEAVNAPGQLVGDQ